MDGGNAILGMDVYVLGPFRTNNNNPSILQIITRSIVRTTEYYIQYVIMLFTSVILTLGKLIRRLIVLRIFNRRTIMSIGICLQEAQE